jgi:plasmid stability protein
MTSMPQLLVRDIEPAIVKKLRSQAASLGISVEEAHRRLLRSALLGETPGPQSDFIAYLRSIPSDEAIEFPRAKGRARSVQF